MNFSPIPDELWKNDLEKVIEIQESKLPKFIKKIVYSKYIQIFLKILLPITLTIKLISLLIPKEEQEELKKESINIKDREEFVFKL